MSFILIDSVPLAATTSRGAVLGVGGITLPPLLTVTLRDLFSLGSIYLQVPPPQFLQKQTQKLLQTYRLLN